MQGGSLNTDYVYGVWFDNPDWSDVGRMSSVIWYDEIDSIWVPNVSKQINESDWEDLNVSISLGIQDGTIAMKVPLAVFEQSAYQVSGGNSTDTQGADRDWTISVYVKID